MQNRWSKKQIEETDDFTFALIILSERRERLNQESLLAEKIFSAFKTLTELRDLCQERPELEPKDAIWHAIEFENTVNDIRHHLGLADDGEKVHADLHGMTPEDVLADKEIVAKIVELIDGGSCEDDYGYIVDFSIEKGVKEVLYERAEELNQSLIESEG